MTVLSQASNVRPIMQSCNILCFMLLFGCVTCPNVVLSYAGGHICCSYRQKPLGLQSKQPKRQEKPPTSHMLVFSEHMHFVGPLCMAGVAVECAAKRQFRPMALPPGFGILLSDQPQALLGDADRRQVQGSESSSEKTSPAAMGLRSASAASCSAASSASREFRQRLSNTIYIE